MKHLEILIELVGELRKENERLKNENTILIEQTEDKDKAIAYWYDKAQSLEKANSATLTIQD